MRRKHLDNDARTNDNDTKMESPRSVPIRINGRVDLPCPIGWAVQEAVERIRSEYVLLCGHMVTNGVAIYGVELYSYGQVITSD